MKIQSLKVARIRPDFEPSLAQLADDPTQDVAWTSDLSHLMPNHAGSLTSVGGLQLYTTGLSALSQKASPKKQKEIKDAHLSLATAGASLLKDQFPQGPVPGIAGGIEVVVASMQAFDSWADPERTSIIKPTIKTARALIAALETLSPTIPVLSELSPQLKTVGLLLRFGDSVYQVHLATSSE